MIRHTRLTTLLSFNAIRYSVAFLYRRDSRILQSFSYVDVIDFATQLSYTMMIPFNQYYVIYSQFKNSLSLVCESGLL